MTVRKWGRPEPTVEDARRVLAWPEEPAPSPVTAAERERLGPLQQIAGWRWDPSTDTLLPGWYGRDRTNFHPQTHGVWYRSLADAVLARRREILRRAVIELTYLEALQAEADAQRQTHP